MYKMCVCIYIYIYIYINQILTHSPQLAAMIICLTVNETNVYTFVTHFHYD